MKVRYILLCFPVIVFLPLCMAKSQEPKVAVEQCRLDADTFIKTMLADPKDQIAEFQAYHEYLKRFPLSEIARRQTEMYDCTTADAKNSQAYKTAALVLDAVEISRYQNFLMRHNLMDQFRAEDANGAR